MYVSKNSESKDQTEHVVREGVKHEGVCAKQIDFFAGKDVLEPVDECVHKIIKL